MMGLCHSRTRVEPQRMQRVREHRDRPLPKVPETRQKLEVGDVVRCASLETLKKENPAQLLSFLEKVACQVVIIVRIQPEKATVLHLLKENGRRNKIVGNISLSCCTFEKEARKVKLSDKISVQMGSFVAEKNTEIKVMRRNYVTGRAGTVNHIYENDKLRIQYATGELRVFSPDELVGSTESKIATKDDFGNWVAASSPVQMMCDKNKFVSLQKESNLQHDQSYLNILGKIVTIKSIKLIPYVFENDIQIISERKIYTVHLNTFIKRIDTLDAFGKRMEVGDNVAIINDNKALKMLQTAEFGGWQSKIREKIGVLGTIMKFDASTRYPVTNLRVQIKFENGEMLTVNPLALKKHFRFTMEEETELSDSSDDKLKYLDSDTEECSRDSPGYSVLDELRNAAGESTPKGCTKIYPNLSGAGADRNLESQELAILQKEEITTLEKIGEGRFGHIYTGKWSGVDCAIKKGKISAVFDRDDILKEARIQFSLRHPNIVQLYGVCVDTEVWMVMQLVKGLDLYSLLWGSDTHNQISQRGGISEIAENLSINTLLDMAEQLANAMAFLHNKGYVHGDIKSTNVMVDTAKNQALLCDFGTAKYLGQEGYTKNYTPTRSGTRFFLAPECLEMDENLMLYQSPNFYSDVWSLGAMFLEMFASMDSFELINSVDAYKQTGDMKGLLKQLKVSEDLPNEIRNIIEQSMKMNPEDRPTSKKICTYFTKK